MSNKESDETLDGALEVELSLRGPENKYYDVTAKVKGAEFLLGGVAEALLPTVEDRTEFFTFFEKLFFKKHMKGEYTVIKKGE